MWLLGGTFDVDLNTIEAGWQVSQNIYGDNNTRQFIYWTDPKDGNWWLQVGNESLMGYWPGSLFSHLSDSASKIHWGGEVVNSQSDGQHTTTQMGSGHFPDEGFGKSSFFKNIQTIDIDNKFKPANDLGSFSTKSSCYDVKTGSSSDWGNYFFYGGPGRNPSCP
ncbi:putative neprosin [Lupinus albus]|uniref:Putative neprosin n=1 Tax=Lupinus albus TaxID=3870 RepID=A0A6A4R8T8_LUPAL|nr:putative neprosin [Lupinus albus]